MMTKKNDDEEEEGKFISKSPSQTMFHNND